MLVDGAAAILVVLLGRIFLDEVGRVFGYRITYFDICGARAIDPWFAAVLLRSLLYFISILIQPTR